jgi:hypothetical protein
VFAREDRVRIAIYSACFPAIYCERPDSYIYISVALRGDEPDKDLRAYTAKCDPETFRTLQAILRMLRKKSFWERAKIRLAIERLKIRLAIERLT